VVLKFDRSVCANSAHTCLNLITFEVINAFASRTKSEEIQKNVFIHQRFVVCPEMSSVFMNRFDYILFKIISINENENESP
jgi:hypothetical protein